MHYLVALGSALLSGAALTFAFAPTSWWFLAPLALAVFHICLHNQAVWRAALIGLLFGLGFFLPLLQWSIISVGSYLPWFALSVFQALFFACYAALRRLALLGRWFDGGAGSILIDALGSALLFIAIEEVRARFPFGGFSWGLLGFSQVDGPLVRAAPLGSTPLVGLLVVMIAVLLTRIVHPPAEGGTRFFARMLAAAIAAAIPVIAIMLPVATYAEHGTLRVGAVQGNVPRPSLGWPDQPLQVTANHRDETLKLLQSNADLDLIVWPESASDLDPRNDEGARSRVLTAATAAAPTPILVGTQQFYDATRTNQHVAFSADSGELIVLGEYTKQHPVPFGEYIPHREFFGKFSSDINQIHVDMVAGHNPAVLTLPRGDGEVVIGDVICFEIAFADVVRQAVNHGAQLLVVPTNNASFGHSAEAAQQTQITRFRAIEYSRAAVQASTVGISALIDGRGRVIAQTPMWQQAHLVGDLPLRSSLTWAARVGIAPSVTAWIGAVGWVLGSLLRRADAKPGHHPDVQRARKPRRDCPAGTFMR